MGKTIVGIILLALGSIFLLANIGMIEADLSSIISTYWPVLIILWGLKEIIAGLYRLFLGFKTGRYHVSQIFWGFAITAAGVILQGNKLDYFTITWSDLWNWFWPLLIIYIGLQFLLKRNFMTIEYKKEEWDEWKKEKENWKEQTKEEKAQWKEHLKEEKEHWKASTIAHDKEAWREWKRKQREGKFEKHRFHKKKPDTSTSKFIGELYLGGAAWHLEDMNIWTGIGETELDLTKAIIPDGETHLNVSGWIGDITIRVPHDMVIKSSVDVKVGEAVLFNHTQSGSARFISYKDAHYDEAEKKINLSISLSIGSVTVRRVD